MKRLYLLSDDMTQPRTHLRPLEQCYDASHDNVEVNTKKLPDVPEQMKTEMISWSVHKKVVCAMAVNDPECSTNEPSKGFVHLFFKSEIETQYPKG